jgi:hypothetical protein
MSTPQEKLIHLCSRTPTGNQWQEPMKEQILSLINDGACLWQADENGLTPIDKAQYVRNGKELRRFLDLLISEIVTNEYSIHN